MCFSILLTKFSTVFTYAIPYFKRNLSLSLHKSEVSIKAFTTIKHVTIGVAKKGSSKHNFETTSNARSARKKGLDY